ncbi:MAG: TolC family protein [bacterium]|nr:TolC family protein [bacterium]MDD3625139.1 TolC family protein [Proteiniphilum sp.]MDD4459544.1 TolC family protein [Proteiniphilum sp.]
MTPRMFLVTLLLLVANLQLLGQEKQVTLSLKETCRLGIEQNTDLLKSSLELQKKDYRLQEKKSRLYPQLEGYSNFGYNYAIPKLVIPGEIFGQTGPMAVEIGTRFDWRSGLRATQLLFNQSYHTSLQLAGSMESMESLNHQQKKEELIFQLSQLYHLCQTTRRQIEQLEAAMDNMEQLLGIAKLQYEQGIIRKVDHARVLVNQNNLQTEADQLLQLHTEQLNMLKYLIGLPVETALFLSDSLSFFPTPQIQTVTDLSQRTELRLLEKKMEMTRLTQKMNRQSRLPTLTGFGEFYFQGQRNRFDYFRGGDDTFYKVGVVGITLQIPLFDGFERKAKSKQFDLELEQLKNSREQLIDYYSKEIADAVTLYESSYRAILRQGENIRVAEKTYEVSLQGYRQQMVPLSDLLLSENSLTEARLSYYHALLQLKNAELGMMKARGELRLLITDESDQ